MAWGEGLGSNESFGGALSGAGTGAMATGGNPYGIAAGAALGLLMGGSQSAQKKKQRQAELMLAAKQAELSPWLTGQAQNATSGLQLGETQQQMNSPWSGAAALAKSYEEMKNKEDKQALINAMLGSYEQLQSTSQPAIQGAQSPWTINPSLYSMQPGMTLKGV